MKGGYHTRFFTVALVFWLTVTLWLGCNEEIAAPPGVDEPFSVYGVITPDLDTQSVLVYATQALPNTVTPERLDATVTSTDLTTGEVRIWNDSLTVDSLGLREHVFWSAFTAEYGHRYRIEVERSDGATSFAEVRVPERGTVELERSDGPFQTVLVRGKSIALPKVQVEYEVVYVNQMGRPKPYPCTTYTWTLTGEQQEIPGGWKITIPMHNHHRWIRAWYALDNRIRYETLYQGIDLKKMSVLVTVGDSVWHPPGLTFDANVLGYPEVLDNVENGFGFIGGGYGREVDIQPSDAALAVAGFLDKGDPECSIRYRSTGTLEGTF